MNRRVSVRIATMLLTLMFTGFSFAGNQAERALLSAHPGVRLHREHGSPARVYGGVFSRGASPAESAGHFVAEHAALFGVEAHDLQPHGRSVEQRASQPVMFDRATGEYKFTLLYYSQYEDGLPVVGAELRLLVRNAPDFPLVWAGSSLVELTEFAPADEVIQGATDPDYVSSRLELAKPAVHDLSPELVNFYDPQVVVWAGLDGIRATPVAAVSFTTDDFSDPQRGPEQSYRIVADARTGEILHKESLIYTGVVDGKVEGLTTEGDGSDQCENELPTPLRHLEVFSAGDSDFTDANGDYSIANGGSTVDAALDGKWFYVTNWVGAETSESVSSSFDVLFNGSNSDELVRGQVNAYNEANIVRDFLVSHNPAYPTMTDEDILVRANRTDGFCPGNAWYSSGDGGSPTGYSINFCQSSSNRPNTAWSSIVHHEFGHHIVQAGGSGQGQYGEGTGDCFSAVILDSPKLGRGFFNDCGGSLRSADNNLQYPCSGASHSCGQLIAGAVWSTRNKLAVSNPTDYTDVLGSLLVNAVLLHNGSSITPSITVDYLTLDDDDGNLLNGTPHYDQINAGFGAHNMAGPGIESGLSVTPKSDLIVTAPSGGPFAPDNVVYTLQNVEPYAMDYKVSVDAPWLSVTNATGTLLPNQSVAVTVGTNGAASALGSGIYSASIAMVNETDHVGDRQQLARLFLDPSTDVAADVPQTVVRLATRSSAIAVTDAFCVGDTNVAIDLSHPVEQDVVLDLQSPTGTVVRLKADGTGSGADLVQTYDIETGVLPDGPGELDDFSFEPVTGDWTLTVINNSTTQAATLNGWSLQFSQLGAICPPRANPVQVVVPVANPLNVVLDGQSGTGGSLDYIVNSLPQFGELSDPLAGAIAGVPHTLAGGGDTVVYTPINGEIGPDAFGYSVNDGVESAIAPVNVRVGGFQVIASFDLNGNPGWTFDGDWAFGSPSGGGNHGGDPTSGKSGANVFGYNLAGDYGNNLAAQTLTSTAIDCSAFADVEVSFWRWLGVEASAFDQASFEVSANGSDWTTIWAHDGATLDETAWSEHSYDISSVADGQPTVFLRWVMGVTDGSEIYAGWNIDDIEVNGVTPPPGITLSITPGGLSWSPVAGATAYDVVRGDLAALRASAGDFTSSTDACVGDDVASTSLAFADEPAVGQGYWLLVRGDSAGAARSFDSFGLAQVGGRDVEIGFAASACP